MRPLKRFSVAISGFAIAGIAAAAMACDVHGDDYSVQLVGSSTATAEIKQFRFQPPEIALQAGGRVTWTNQDGVAHTITAGTPDAPTQAFDSGEVAKGSSFTMTFEQPGEYAYFCNRHKSMRGVVKATSAP